MQQPGDPGADDKRRLFGIEIDGLTMEQTIDRVDELITTGTGHQHVAINAAKVVEMEDDPSLRTIVNDCSLVSADGQAVVWAARLLGQRLPERVAGIDLMEGVLALAARRGHPVYFLGAREDVLQRTVQIESKRYPGLIVAGARNGYWAPEEEDSVVQAVAGSGAAILLVAMPTPRKEFFLGGHRRELGVRFMMGVGGSFDVVAGVTARAPNWMRRVGLEWGYRLIQEPRRMFRRYLVGNTRFSMLVLREWRATRRRARLRGARGSGPT